MSCEQDPVLTTDDGIRITDYRISPTTDNRATAQ
jgi:hypothetical protein